MDHGEGIRLGLREKLVLALLPVVVGVFGLVWLSATTAARSGLETLNDQNLELAAQNLADAVGRSFDDAAGDALTSARLDLAAQAIESGDPKNFVWYADELVRTKDKYVALLVADDTGTIAGASSVRRGGGVVRTELRGKDLGDGPWVKQALEAERGTRVWLPAGRPEVLADYLEPDEQVTGFGLPVVDILGETIGTLWLVVSLDFIGERLAGYVIEDSSGPRALALLVDGGGRPVALPHRIATHGAWRDVALPAAGERTWTDPTGTVFHLAQLPVRGTAAEESWRVATLTTAAQLDAPVRAITGRLSAVFAVAGLALLAALIFVATRFVRPIHRLTEATSRVERAATYEPIAVQSSDEIGSLTRSFNHMMGTIRDYEASLESKVRDRTRELTEAKQELTDILDNMAQGIFTVHRDGSINQEMSAFCRRLFGDVAMAGEPVMKVLQLDGDDPDASRMAFWLRNIFGADELQWVLSAQEGVSSVVYQRPDGEARIIDLEYAPIFVGGVVEKIMVVAKDVTQLRELADEVARKDAQLRDTLLMAAEIARMEPELFGTFMGESMALVEQCRAALDALERDPGSDAVHDAFRAVHTLKGNARIYKLTTVHDEANRLEDVFSLLRDGGTASEELKGARERLEVVAGVLGELDELGRTVLAPARDAESEASGVRLRTAPIPEARIVAVRSAFRSLERATKGGGLPAAVLEHKDVLGAAIEELTSVPIGLALDRFRKVGLDLARELGRKLHDVEVIGGDVEVDVAVLNRVRDVLVHALRNAVDHGIEPPAERLARGKEERGRIRLACRAEDAHVVIEVSDDGAGVDFHGVRSRARALGIASEEQLERMEHDELVQLLFRPGFSTAHPGSSVSGRGVGLDTIRASLTELGGTAALTSRAGEGTVLTLRIGRKL